jgi:hypothetical protein
MKLLVSWSGPTSNEIAKAFRKWINMINQSIEPYMSEEDIEKGSRWSAGLSRQLEQTNYGVIVLTPENTKSEWLHFEAGAIARSVDESRVSPILIGLKPLDVRLPLSQFQLTEFHKQDVWKLVKSINTAAGAGAKSDELLQRMFEALWPKFEEEVVSLAKNLTAPQPAASVPLLDTILQELLTLVRQQARILAMSQLYPWKLTCERTSVDFAFGPGADSCTAANYVRGSQGFIGNASAGEWKLTSVTPYYSESPLP